MRLVYYLLHFVLICVIAPWMIGAAYSIVLSNYDALFIAGLGIVVFSLPITLSLSIVCLILFRFFDFELNRIYSCISGMAVGFLMGILLGQVLDGEIFFYLIASGSVGIFVGYIEYVLSISIRKTA